MLIVFNDLKPLNRQIYDALRSRVISGELSAGERLPATRELAKMLSVSRTTVLQAYDQLIAEGYIHTQKGSGTFVSQPHTSVRPTTPGRKKRANDYPLSDAALRSSTLVQAVTDAFVQKNHPTIRYDFRPAYVAMDDRASTVWRSLMSQSMKDQTNAAPFDPQGYLPLREAIAGHLRRVRNCNVTAHNVVMTNGTQQALDLLTRVFINPGDKVAVEDPGYFGVRLAIATSYGNAVNIALDDQGICIEALKQHGAKAKLVYVTPSHQFPAGSVMSLHRRMALLEWANQNNACIVEDDYDSEFNFKGKPVEAIQAIDVHERTIYVGTFSKVLSPELRLGYLVAPDGLVPALTAMQWVEGMQSTLLQQQALARWMHEGHHTRHLRRMHKVYAERRELILQHLSSCFSDGGICIEGSDTGLHFLLWLQKTPKARAKTLDKLMSRLSDEGVALYPVDICYSKPPKKLGFLLGFGNIAVENIPRAIRVFKNVVAECL